MAGVDNSMADLINRCEHSELNAELRHRRRDVDWREQEMRRKEEEKCSDLARRYTFGRDAAPT